MQKGKVYNDRQWIYTVKVIWYEKELLEYMYIYDFFF